ncbi:MAG: SPOR domain-containing protein [Betaproteobacteria bacterium]
MKGLAGALLIVNLALFTWGWLREHAPRVEDALAGQELNRDRLRILAGESEPVPVPVPTQTPASLPTTVVLAEACLEWAPFAADEAERAREALQSLALGPRLVEGSVTVPAGWWVYIPPFRSRQQAERRVAELARQGVKDTYIVQERGDWENAVSLGVFRGEEGARRYLETLKARGLRSVVVGARQQQARLVALYIREPREAETQRLTDLRQAFPGTAVRAGRCP